MTALAKPGPGTDMERLCHDLRQYAAAGLLAADMPGDECLDEGVRRRLGMIRELFAGIRDPVAVHAGETRTTSNVDLVDLIDECVRVAELNHGVSAVLVHTGPVLVHADAVLLRRAIGNVLDNAARATGAGGSVTVTVESDSRAACVEVVDEGLGFGHVAPGSGQGLSIVDMALRACKGRLEITSGPGPGTTVRLLFPVRDDGGGHEPRAV